MDAPELRLTSSGDDPSRVVVMIKGYISQNDDIADWVHSIRSRGFNGDIYHLWWDSSSIGGIAKSVFVGNKAALWTPALVAGGPLAILGTAFGIAPVQARLHWSKLKRRAKRSGRDHVPKLLADAFAPEVQVSLVAFSLGARVAYYTMDTIARTRHRQLHSVILVGGAVRRDGSKDWGLVAHGSATGILNVYNRNDQILRGFFRIAELKNNACGARPIKEESPAIRNLDATEVMQRHDGVVGSHTEWANEFGRLGCVMPWDA